MCVWIYIYLYIVYIYYRYRKLSLLPAELKGEQAKNTHTQVQGVQGERSELPPPVLKPFPPTFKNGEGKKGK